MSSEETIPSQKGSQVYGWSDGLVDPHMGSIDIRTGRSVVNGQNLCGHFDARGRHRYHNSCPAILNVCRVLSPYGGVESEQPGGQRPTVPMAAHFVELVDRGVRDHRTRCHCGSRDVSASESELILNASTEIIQINHVPSFGAHQTRLKEI